MASLPSIAGLAPYRSMVAVSTSDLDARYRGLLCSGAGSVKIDTENGETVTFAGVAGTIYPILAKKVYGTSSGTSGTWFALN
jgi:hypothetical protein